MQPFNVLISHTPEKAKVPEILFQGVLYAKNNLCAAALAAEDACCSTFDASTLEVVVVPFAK